MEAKIAKATKYFLDVLFVAGIIITATVPITIVRVLQFFNMDIPKNIHLLKIILIVCGIFAVLIIWELRSMFKSVILKDCFVRRNVSSLRKMGGYSFVIMVMMIGRCLFIRMTLSASCMVMVFLIAGLFSFVLAMVFDEAVNHKEENDLTI